MYIEVFIVGIIFLFVFFYRKNAGDTSYKFIVKSISGTYEKYAPYSFKVVREKAKELGQEYTSREYAIPVAIFGVGAAFISYLYFYSIIWSIIYAVAAIAFVPYLAFLRCKKSYSEFIFEQIQVYTTNVIMEYNTTQSFVKALEGVRDSGVLEDPLLTDIKENMSLDIDMLVENVYRDRIDRSSFYSQFVMFGLILYLLVLLVQLLLGSDSYLLLIEKWYVIILLHCVILINTGFLLSGIKYYHENVGAE